MKRIKRIAFLTGWSGVLLGFAGFDRSFGAPAQSEEEVVSRGFHHRVWERTIRELLPDGRTEERKSSYTELGTSMHFWKDNQFHESNARFRLFPGGAVADEGMMQLIVAPDAAAEPLLDLLATDAQRWQMSPRWLVYHNRVTQEATLIAAIKSCAGQLVSPNRILFPDAFDQIHAALRITYQPWGAEQEVVLLESGPLRPADWGINGDPANIVLEVWSEFHLWPEGGVARTSIESGLEDVKLEFGPVQIGIGKAFSLGDEENGIVVGKTWTSVVDPGIGPRQFLIEAVRQSDLAPLLGRLPQQAQANNPARAVRGVVQQKPVIGRDALFARGRERVKDREKPKEMAAITRAPSRLSTGISIDYSVVTTTSNLRLKGDSTYLITNSVTLSGTTTIEGGAILKFSNVTNAGSNRLLITGPIVCDTSVTLPAILTSRDDDTVGESLSTGALGTNRYAGRALDLNAANTAFDLHDLHFRHVDKAIYISSSSVTCLLSHVQIGYANQAINNSHPNFTARNILVHDALTAVSGSTSSTNRLEHATFHRVGTFRSAGTVFATNSLFICVTNGLVFTGGNVATNLSDTGVFKTVGAGSRYLNGNVYRNSGTTNISPTLLSAIRLRTTYPPVVLTGDIVSDTTLYPQAPRDTDLPDLGWHYLSLDYCWSGLTLSNATLRLAGVAVAVYGTNGIWLQSSAKFISQGTPTAVNRLTRYDTVQEEPMNWGATAGTMSLRQLGQVLRPLETMTSSTSSIPGML